MVLYQAQGSRVQYWNKLLPSAWYFKQRNVLQICKILSLQKSSMIVEVIRTNVKLFFFFFLQENFISIKSKKSIKNIYKQISDFLKHKTLNKQLSLRCFYEHKKHKTLFTSIKSYAQDAVYQHKMSFVSTRCCL